VRVSPLFCKMLDGSLGRALNATKIAVFGASATPGKLGNAVATRLIRDGFAGEIALVNPRPGELLGHRFVAASEAAAADVAAVVTPIESVAAVLDTCAELDIPLAVVYASPRVHDDRERGSI
jgi:acyl-CoA synthetase (NDP forming)